MTLEILQLFALLLISFITVGLLVVVGDLGRTLSSEGVTPSPTGLEIGRPLPRLTAVDARTNEQFEIPKAASPGTILFLSGACLPCKSLVADIAALQSTAQDTDMIVGVADGPGAEWIILRLPQKVRVFRYGIPEERLFDIHWLPLAYAVDPGGVVRMRSVPLDRNGLAATMRERGGGSERVSRPVPIRR